ncbi:MAG: hypothetical protein ACKVRN_10690 [Pyrinomonadaceae bacterium]
MSGSPSRKKIVLVPLDAETTDKIKAAQRPFVNIPAVNHLEECAEYSRLIRDEEFCAQFKNTKLGVPIKALDFDWYGQPRELITIILQRAILGTESFVNCIVLQETVQRNLTNEKTRNYFLNPFSLRGQGTADNYYNKLPALVDPNYRLADCDSILWEEVQSFYKTTRNPIFHGNHINSDDPTVLQPHFDLIRRLFLWMDTWFVDRVGTIMPIDIKRYWS